MVKKKNISVRTQLLVATGAVLLLTVFGLFVGWLDSNMGINLTSKAESVSLQDVTLKGTSTCIGHTGNGPHTEECLLGIKTASGAVYAVEGGDGYTTEQDLEVTGTLTPPSKDETRDIAGTLTIK